MESPYTVNVPKRRTILAQLVFYRWRGFGGADAKRLCVHILTTSNPAWDAVLSRP